MPLFPDGGTGAGQGTHWGDTSVVEDVTNIIYQITPLDTPFFNLTGDTRSRAVTHEWQIRSLTTRQHNAQPEGFTYTFTDGLRLPTREFNTLQIFQKDVRVSGTNQAIGHYAIDDMFADQMQSKLTEMKTDIEHALLQSTLSTGSASAVRKMEGMIQVMQGASNTYTNYAGTGTLDEDGFNDHIQVCWEQGGAPRDWLMGGTMKRRISGFSAGSTKFISSDEQRLVNTISVYESDFFPVNLHLSRDIPTASTTSGYTGFALLGVDRTMVRKAWLRTVKAKMVPETADSKDGVIVGELTQETGNDQAHFYVDRTL